MSGDMVAGLLIGCFVGFVLGYLTNYLRAIKSELDEVIDDLEDFDTCVRKCKEDHVHIPPRRPKKTEGGFMRKPIVADVAYLFALFLILYGLWGQNRITNNIEAKAHADLVARCQSGTESRTVQRETIEAIYHLAIGSIQRPANAPPLTRQELSQYNAYIARVNRFRDDMYKKIIPSSQCKPYVEDDYIPPPTPPQPPLTNSGRNS